MAELFSYSIPHLTIRLESIKSEGRVKFLVSGKPLVVEAAATEYLRGEDWWVTQGDQASLFFAVLSANFRGSFFADVCKNYVGPDSTNLVNDLERLCKSALKVGEVSEHHLKSACNFLCRYYRNPSYHRRFNKLVEISTTFAQAQKIGLLKMYSSLGYFTKGIPDLFAARPGEFMFVEVKSESDALRPEQYIFAETLIRLVGSGFLVLRILSTTGADPTQLANPADTGRQ